MALATLTKSDKLNEGASWVEKCTYDCDVDREHIVNAQKWFQRATLVISGKTKEVIELEDSESDHSTNDQDQKALFPPSKRKPQVKKKDPKVSRGFEIAATGDISTLFVTLFPAANKGKCPLKPEMSLSGSRRHGPPGSCVVYSETSPDPIRSIRRHLLTWHKLFYQKLVDMSSSGRGKDWIEEHLRQTAPHQKVGPEKKQVTLDFLVNKNALIKSHVCQTLNMIIHSGSFNSLDLFHAESYHCFGLDNNVALSRSKIPKYINLIYEFISTYIKKEMATIESFAVTTDGWTSVRKEKFVAITCHYFNQEWSLENIFVDISEFSKPHTAQNLSTHLQSKLDGYPGLIGAQVCDGAKNEQNSGALTVGLDDTVWCFAHVLHLIVLSSIQHSITVIDKLREYIKSFRQSSTKMYLLRDFLLDKSMKMDGDLDNDVYDKRGRKISTLILDVVTRWRSTAQMIGRYLALEPVLTMLHVQYSSEFEKLSPLSFTEKDALVQIHAALIPFAAVSQFAQSVSFPTCCLVAPWSFYLKEELSKLKPTNIDAEIILHRLIEGIDMSRVVIVQL